MLFKDTDACPDVRAEDCINCKQRWGSHRGWACPTANKMLTRRSQLSPNEQYLTLDMNHFYAGFTSPRDLAAASNRVLDALDAERQSAAQPRFDISDWRAWRNNKSDECACGIHKSRCEYHK